jgi:hypothetical protein
MGEHAERQQRPTNCRVEGDAPEIASDRGRCVGTYLRGRLMSVERDPTADACLDRPERAYRLQIIRGCPGCWHHAGSRTSIALVSAGECDEDQGDGVAVPAEAAGWY